MRFGSFLLRFRRNETPSSSVTSVNLRTLQIFVVLFVCSIVRCLVLFCENCCRVFCFLQFAMYLLFIILVFAR